MKNLVNRAQMALNGEGGGPSVEQVLGIAFALIIASAIFLFGGKLVEWMGTAGDTVSGWADGEGKYEDYKKTTK